LAKKNKIYEGKTKILYEAEKPEQLLMKFSDDMLPSGAKKKSVVKGKGAVNNQVSAFLFKYLDGYNVPNHFVKEVSDTEMLVKKTVAIRITVVMRNIATDDLCKRFDFEKGSDLPVPILEYYLKNDDLKNPLMNEYHIYAQKLATQQELLTISKLSLKINAVLKSFFQRRDLQLIEYSTEFGRFGDKLLLIDEMSPETCRLRDLKNPDVSAAMTDLEPSKLGAVYQEIQSRVLA